jgi:hypothetical protein
MFAGKLFVIISTMELSKLINRFNELINSNCIFKYIFGATLLLLLIPVIAMQFSTQVNWQLFDFIVMGVLIFSTSSIFVLVARKIRNKNKLLITVILFGLVFMYIWAELAVGIFTNLGN